MKRWIRAAWCLPTPDCRLALANGKKREVKFGEMTASGASSGSPALRLCRQRRIIVAGARELRLPDLSFRLLDLLASRAPDDVSYEEIEQAVWNARVTRETVKQRVKLLREALAPLGLPDGAIEVVRNVGYRTTLEIGPLEPGSSRFDQRRLLIWLAAILGVVAVAAVIAILARGPDATSVRTLVVESTDAPTGVDREAWDGARRALIRDLSKNGNIRVLDRRQAGDAPALLVRLALDRGSTGMRLSTELIDGPSGAVLLADSYRYDPQNVERALAHFTSNAHARIATLSLQSETRGFAPQPEAIRTAYARAFRLWRQGDRPSLVAARAALEQLLAENGDIPLASSLLARVKADLVLRHGAEVGLAREARRDAERLVAAHPDSGEFRYSLARTLIALGERRAALDQLRIARQDMPFLSRDIAALERDVP